MVEQNTINSPMGLVSLQQTIQPISSLITLSHSVKVFAVKWQSIRDQLQQLLSCLSSIENCDSINNPSFLTALESITTTLKDCDELARRCVELSYSGKLLMKSDLDIMCGRLNNHVKDLSEIYNLGLITQNYAIVLSKPGHGASRDAMKIYVGDLFSRLKIGSAGMTKEALIALNEVFQEDDKYIRIAMEVDSFILILVKFLESQEDEIQQEAIKALFFIARSVKYRNALIVSGIVSPLVRVLECGPESSKEYAARCLEKLTENSDNAWSVSAHGGVTYLLKICSNGNSGEELVSSACGVLKNLVGVEEIKRFMVEEGAIHCLIKLVRSRDGIAQICSIDFLQTMACGDESIKSIIVKEGGAQALVRVLDPKRMFPTKAREVALKGIMSLSFSLMYTLNMLLSYGFLDHVLYFLRFGEVGVQELALKASFWLCGTSEEAKKAMGDAGLMPELVKFLDSNSFDVRERAAETLYCLILIPKNRKRFVQNDENVGLILQVLDKEAALNCSGGGGSNKKLLLTLIMSLTGSNSARKKIVNSGYLKKIEKLADSENPDAKKIVKKLTSNRLRNLLNGIWHYY